jgi:glutathionyl-hydroquinone reductase
MTIHAVSFAKAMARFEMARIHISLAFEPTRYKIETVSPCPWAMVAVCVRTLSTKPGIFWAENGSMIASPARSKYSNFKSGTNTSQPLDPLQVTTA